MADGPGGQAHWLRGVCSGLWALLLAAPSATVFAPTHVWDVQPLATFTVTLWVFASLWILVGRRLFFALTYPIALFGAIAMAAGFWRNVDILELLLAGATDRREIVAAIRPYGPALAILAGLLAAQLWLAIRQRPGRPVSRWIVAPLVMLFGAALWAWSSAALARAWPVNVVAVALAQFTGHSGVVASSLPYAAVNPRQPGASWNAQRVGATGEERETYVLVIGESVRADRLQACGGRPAIGPAAAGSLVFCNVMASSSSTHTAVPLLLSRELPGGTLRVSEDATFMRAFEETGFRTTWLSVQEPRIAWPDALRSAYVPLHGSDRASLLAPLRSELATAPTRQLVVLHAYNAHYDYCDRLGGASPLVAVDCARLGALPTRGRRDEWLAAYDNAVHESMRFLDAVIDAAGHGGGEVFVLYVPDHGENLLDDGRDLFQHALQQPTRWDTRVPMIVHANEAWRRRHPGQWAQLGANASAAVMHADVVPTLLGAAGIRYDEPRAVVTDLTSRRPWRRTRWVLRRLGEIVDGDTL